MSCKCLDIPHQTVLANLWHISTNLFS